MPGDFTLIALDLATRTGVAVGEPGKRPQAWSHKIDSDSLGEFLAQWHAYLAGVVQTTVPEPGLIAFEMPILGPKTALATARRLIGLCGVLQMVAHRYRLPLREVRSMEACRFFTGKGSYGRGKAGRALKKAATLRQCDLLGWAAKDDDSADALMVWAWAERFHTRAPERRLPYLEAPKAASQHVVSSKTCVTLL